jgi:uncharacterized protein YprB with RNaseH-like and TPR domain
VNIDAQDYLDLCEATASMVFVDIEALGLKADYGSSVCVSLKRYGKKPYTLVVKQPGNDQKLVREAKEELEKYRLWVTYYGKGFDIPFLNTRLLRWGAEPIEKRPHVDLFFTLKANVLTARKSQAHLLGWLGTKEQKMSISASDWADLPFNPRLLETMVKRCESDVTGLEALYRRCRHVINDIKR